MKTQFIIPRSDFDQLAQCGHFGRLESKQDGFTVVICGHGDKWRARVWIGFDVQATSMAKTARAALVEVVDTDPPIENPLKLTF